MVTLKPEPRVKESCSTSVVIAWLYVCYETTQSKSVHKTEITKGVKNSFCVIGAECAYATFPQSNPSSMDTLLLNPV